MKKQWEKAGIKVMEMIPSRSFAKTPVSTEIAALRSLDGLLIESRKRMDELKKETGRLDAALEEMPGKGGVKKRIAWIESSLEERRNALDEAYRVLGRSWGESNTTKSRTGAVEDRRLEWIACLAGITKHESQVALFNEHLEYLDAQELADETRTGIEKLDKEIRSRQTEMKKLKRELSLQEKQLEQRKERLPRLPAEQS
jgi:chromosome segregation ATPase